ncbi:MAG: sugar phosphate nucleotidyltransferase [Rikenellaceae bacterium]
MQIILLSGGSGKRLWPLSNDARSKQFLKLLQTPEGSAESMMQRIARQISTSGIEAQLTVATSITQYDSIRNQLGDTVDVVTEPMRRDTFPAIALSASYLIKEKQCSKEEVVIVMPSDSYVEEGYFATIAKMAAAVESDAAEMVLMGVTPTEPSTKFGYIVPNANTADDEIKTVNRFTEKPDEERAKELLKQGVVWNGGVFAFRLGYIEKIIDKYIQAETFTEIRDRYTEFPKISFDYEVVEPAQSIAFVPYSGAWSDLGTWNSLTQKIERESVGNVATDEKCTNTHIINELGTPIICLGVENLIVAASPDGILVSTKEASVNLKSYADTIGQRPMYEERRWGTYRVMGNEKFEDGHHALTKLICINADSHISYQYHNDRDEVWTVVDGEGELVIEGERTTITRGQVAHIKAGTRHAVRAITNLQIIEIQSGINLTEEDIIRLDWKW